MIDEWLQQLVMSHHNNEDLQTIALDFAGRHLPYHAFEIAEELYTSPSKEIKQFASAVFDVISPWVPEAKEYPHH
ncbi:MAG: hypothetical protein ACRC5C_11510 [Bacilli bacterium]